MRTLKQIGSDLAEIKKKIEGVDLASIPRSTRPGHQIRVTELAQRKVTLEKEFSDTFSQKSTFVFPHGEPELVAEFCKKAFLVSSALTLDADSMYKEISHSMEWVVFQAQSERSRKITPDAWMVFSSALSAVCQRAGVVGIDLSPALGAIIRSKEDLESWIKAQIQRSPNWGELIVRHIRDRAVSISLELETEVEPIYVIVISSSQKEAEKLSNQGFGGRGVLALNKKMSDTEIGRILGKIKQEKKVKS